ncbi:hypothetical protein [Amphibacillus jilinensis]|uniref:hypothetical protein n=1 Tax=Amphibacillus jilinensis TaxID=1216008 RepID=UPI000307C121|nr:hypothetical protein [Amphibacillus jilinensis]
MNLQLISIEKDRENYIEKGCTFEEKGSSFEAFMHALAVDGSVKYHVTRAINGAILHYLLVL